MKKYEKVRYPFGTVFIHRHEESTYLRIKARSQKHANRLASALDWYSFYSGVGQPFAKLFYNTYRKRLEMYHSWDI